MKEVRVMKRFQCDFCKKRSTKARMEKHELRCFQNPNRFCDFCENKGYTREHENGYTYEQPCPYCSSEDLSKTKAIKDYKKEKQNTV